MIASDQIEHQCRLLKVGGRPHMGPLYLTSHVIRATLAGDDNLK